MLFDNKEKEYLLSILKSEPETVLNKKLISRLERSMKRIKPRSAKRKGLDWQKECCEMIGRATGVKYDGKDDCGEIRSRESSRAGVDIIISGKAAEKFDWNVECKNTKNLSIPEWIRQAQNNSGGRDNWLLLIKSQSIPGKKIAVMSFDKFEQITKKLCGG